MDLRPDSLDLFAGPGGWSQGLHTLGLADHGLEIDPWACATRRASGHVTEQVDVTLIDPGLYADVPGFIASPPCRPFSPGGLRQGLTDRELVAAAIDDLAAGRDTRVALRALCANPESMLAAEPMRWLYQLRPEWVCMEQVPAVLPLWQQYARHLAAWGYSVWAGVVDAGGFGVPQTRRRAVFIASRVRDVGPPAATHATAPAMRDVIPGIAADTVLVSRRDSVARLAAHGPRRNRTGDQPAPTVTGEVWRWKWDDHGAVRPVAPAEAGQLQTFPADYPWRGPKTRVARQIGDAVPPRLATAVVAVATGAAASTQLRLTAAGRPGGPGGKLGQPAGSLNHSLETLMDPYYEDRDAGIALYLGDMREVLPALAVQADLIVADPPYQSTSLAWDRWPDGWPAIAAAHTSSMWCFGSMRMFLDRRDQFTDWKLSQDVVWEKANGTGFATDRFKRVHEIATHWYRGNWATVHHDTPRTAYVGPDKHPRARQSRTPHTGTIGAHFYEDDGTRLARSVLQAKSVRGGVHPTEKPMSILRDLVTYACPPGGLVLDPFAGSGSTLDAARQSGRRAIGIEADERYCEAARLRLSALTLPAA